MNVVGSGFVAVLIYSSTHEGMPRPSPEPIFTEASDAILTEASDEITTE